MATVTCKSGGLGLRPHVKINDHPCFNADVKTKHGRIHLPVARRCNIQCNYCSRLYDCPNEGRPGVSSSLLAPPEALARLDEALELLPGLSVVGIAGPGDPLANGEEVFETFRLVRKKHPQLLLCVSTNGFAVKENLSRIIDSGITHITLTINAVDEAIGEKIYRWIKLEDKKYRGIEAAGLLLKRQLEAVGSLKRAGFIVKVNTVVIPGINSGHIQDIAKKMRELSVDLFNPMPIFPVKGTKMEDIPEPTREEMRAIGYASGAHLPLMTHCRRCRADAAGLIGEDMASSWRRPRDVGSPPPRCGLNDQAPPENLRETA